MQPGRDRASDAAAAAGARHGWRTREEGAGSPNQKRLDRPARSHQRLSHEETTHRVAPDRREGGKGKGSKQRSHVHRIDYAPLHAKAKRKEEESKSSSQQHRVRTERGRRECVALLGLRGCALHRGTARRQFKRPLKAMSPLLSGTHARARTRPSCGYGVGCGSTSSRSGGGEAERGSCWRQRNKRVQRKDGAMVGERRGQGSDGTRWGKGGESGGRRVDPRAKQRCQRVLVKEPGVRAC